MTRAAFLLLGTLAAGATLPAAPQEVPGAKTELVRLDVVVTDAHGRPVGDLTREDFEVFEDGKPQQLTHFALESHARAAPAAEATIDVGAPAEISSPRPPAPVPVPAARTVVVIVDDLHIAAGNLDFVKQGLRHVDELTAPEDRVALVTTSSSVLIQPTTDRAMIRQAIGRLTSRAAVMIPALGSQMTPVQAEMILAGERSALELAARTILADPGSITGGSGAFAAEAKQRAAEAQAQRQARGVLAEAMRFSAATLGTVADVMSSLAPFPGRKLCLLVSDGFLVGARTSEERTNDMRRIVDAATRSGAVVYALDSRGLTTAVADAGVAALDLPPGLQARVERQGEQIARNTLTTLADDTGGFLVRGTNDMAAGLRRMLDDNDTYYLVAYEPNNTRRDGRFRRIKVRILHRSGLTVRTRKGYLAPDDRKRVPAGVEVARATGRGLAEAQARALLLTPASESGIPVTLTADWFDLPPAGPRAVVRAHVDVSHLRWQEAQGRRRAAVELIGGIYDADGRPVGAPFGKSAALDLGPREFASVATSGLQYQEVVPLRPGRYQVRLVAREPGAQELGGAAQWVDIPDLAGGALALSSLFLSSSAPRAAAPAASDDALRDAHTLRRFSSAESLYFQLYVYNVARAGRAAPDVVLQAQIVRGTTVIAASKPQPVALQQKDGVPVPETDGMPLQGLAAGSYQLRVVVVDRKANATASRSVDFTID